jgi:ribokinase
MYKNGFGWNGGHNMKILVLGSINIDFNYSVTRITAPKETRASTGMKMFPGGKGMNQAITLARAGMSVRLAAMIGKDGTEMLEQITQAGVDTSLVRVVDDRTGHAIIQVDEVGQNAILLYRGANGRIDREYVDSVLEDYEKGDVLLLQNEISCMDYILEKAAEKELYIILNPSPFSKELLEYDLSKVSMFCLNEVEGKAMTSYVQPGDILIRLEELYPDSEFIFTLGADGAFYKKGASQCYHPAIKVTVADSTAAGDVFEGYFLAAYLRGQDAAQALQYASYAAALSISHEGAALYSAPLEEDVKAFIQKKKN